MSERPRTPARYVRTLLASWLDLLAEWIYELALRLEPPAPELEDGLEPEVLELQLGAYVRREAYVATNYWVQAEQASRYGTELHAWVEAHPMADGPMFIVMEDEAPQVFGRRWAGAPDGVRQPTSQQITPEMLKDAEQPASMVWCNPPAWYAPPEVQALLAEPGAEQPAELEDQPAAPELLEELASRGGEVRISPDFDAYAAGELDASQIRCVLCSTAPCSCEPCDTCGFTKQARYNGCPRGCAEQ